MTLNIVKRSVRVLVLNFFTVHYREAGVGLLRTMGIIEYLFQVSDILNGTKHIVHMIVSCYYISSFPQEQIVKYQGSGVQIHSLKFLNSS